MAENGQPSRSQVQDLFQFIPTPRPAFKEGQKMGLRPAALQCIPLGLNSTLTGLFLGLSDIEEERWLPSGHSARNTALSLLCSFLFTAVTKKWFCRSYGKKRTWSVAQTLINLNISSFWYLHICTWGKCGQKMYANVCKMKDTGREQI